MSEDVWASASLYEKHRMQVVWLSSHSQLAALCWLPVYQLLILADNVCSSRNVLSYEDNIDITKIIW
jgi:hypothetical protein